MTVLRYVRTAFSSQSSLSDAQIARIEEAGNRQIPDGDRPLLNRLFLDTMRARELSANAANAGIVRRHLERIAKNPATLLLPRSDRHWVTAVDLLFNGLTQARRQGENKPSVNRVAAEAAQSLRVISKRGREIDLAEQAMLLAWASFFERVGGNVSAAWVESDGRGSRQTPFVRFVTAVGREMPPQHRLPFCRGLEDRLRRVAALYKRHDLRTDFDEIDFSP